MNKLSGHIISVVSHGNLSRVLVKVSDINSLHAVVIENPQTADYLKEGAAVNLIFKETEVILSTDDRLMSVANRIPGEVTKVEYGKILSRIDVRWEGGTLSSIADSTAIKAMSLQKGTPLLVLIPFNQIMLQPV